MIAVYIKVKKEKRQELITNLNKIGYDEFKSDDDKDNNIDRDICYLINTQQGRSQKNFFCFIADTGDLQGIDCKSDFDMFITFAAIDKFKNKYQCYIYDETYRDSDNNIIVSKGDIGIPFIDNFTKDIFLSFKKHSIGLKELIENKNSLHKFKIYNHITKEK